MNGKFIIEHGGNMIQFDEATHTYSKNGVPYTSVTTILKNYNISADYSNIPTNVMATASARGKQVHKELEEYIKHNTVGQSQDFINFTKWVAMNSIPLNPAYSECVVYNDLYLVAGTIDFMYDEDGHKVIIDFKTTSSIHWDSVTWQLSIYNYLISNGDVIEYYSNKLKVIHMYNNKYSVKELPLIPYDEIEKLLEANLTSAAYIYNPDTSTILSDSEAIVLHQLLYELGQCDTIMKDLQEKKKAFEKKILDNMVNQNIHSVNVAGLQLTRSDISVRKTLDATKVKEYFKVNNIDINPFIKTSTTDAKVIITVKGTK